MSDETAWLQTRITKTEQLIEAIEDAILKLSTGHQSYTLDTGQTRQTVTSADIGSLRLQLSSLDNRRASLRARLGCAAVVGRPAY